MDDGFGGFLAACSAFCYALSSVAIIKSARSPEGRGNDVIVSILITTVVSGALWLFLGPDLPSFSPAALIGVGYFTIAGFLGNVLGRQAFFRSVELAGAIETGFIRRLTPFFATILAFFLLGEGITVVIVSAFCLVTGGILIMISSPNLQYTHSVVQTVPGEKNIGRAIALGSAASYGGAFVLRKLAMQTFPDPLAGVFIGAATGLLWFGFSGFLKPWSRRSVKPQFRMPGAWQLLSGALMTAGQVALFFSLMFTTVTVVAIISSVEMFFTAWLAAMIFKTEKRPGPYFYLAASIAGAGVILLALSPAPR